MHQINWECFAILLERDKCPCDLATHLCHLSFPNFAAPALAILNSLDYDCIPFPSLAYTTFGTSWWTNHSCRTKTDYRIQSAMTPFSQLSIHHRTTGHCLDHISNRILALDAHFCCSRDFLCGEFYIQHRFWCAATITAQILTVLQSRPMTWFRAVGMQSMATNLTDCPMTGVTGADCTHDVVWK